MKPLKKQKSKKVQKPTNHTSLKATKVKSNLAKLIELISDTHEQTDKELKEISSLCLDKDRI